MSDSRGRSEFRADWRGCIAAVALVALATAIGWPLHHKLGISNTNVLMVYLLVVLWIATRYTRMAAVIASVLGVIVFDVMFVPPYYQLMVHDRQYILTFVVMLMTALVISHLTVRSRTHAEAARQAWARVEAENLRNTLLSGVSHDLRTPLAGIAGAASALCEARDGLSAESQREMLDTILTESQRMERLIDNLLDMSRLGAGGLNLKLEWQPFQEVVGAALNHLARRLRGRKVSVDLPGDLTLVRIDAVAIEQVLVNLLDNALQHTPDGSPIEIFARADADRSTLTVTVSDHGPGLPPGAERRIFDKFVRLPTTSGRRGIGLGLAICRGIVRAHGGTIEAINSDNGRGATFRFTLPIPQGSPVLAPDADDS